MWVIKYDHRWNYSYNVSLCLLLFLFIGVGNLRAQYFGKNKVKYKGIEYQVSESPNFEMYHYFDSDSLTARLLRNSEHWYNLHKTLFQIRFEQPNPIIFYQNHPEFQQTAVISGLIGEGTGGVTEGFKNRVVMPLMFTHRQTDHVLGHELVHAFQFQLLTSGESTTLSSMQNIPLWMIEGLAEYMSIGRVDPHTAMWMRDAVSENDIPRVRDLNKPQYFPYRYGHAFWAFVTGIWGDEAIRPLFVQTARIGLDNALKSVLGVNERSLSEMWIRSMKNTYDSLYQASTKEKPVGKKIASPLNAGEMNISPSLSPNGQYMAFLSEKNVVSIDLYVIETRTGRIIQKLSRESQATHIDAYSFMESAGAWSPDSRKFAIPVVSKGQNKLLILDVLKNRKEELISIPGVPALSHPAWSPDGNSIVFSGLVKGHSDLYLYDLDRKQVFPLTQDIYSDIQPAWSPDGSEIVFASDRLGDPDRLEKARFSINRLNVNTGEITLIPVFLGADNLNPIYGVTKDIIYFLSDRDGFRNIYAYDYTQSEVFQLTDFFTGVSGITEFSPAISVSSATGEIVYTHYQKNGYNIYYTEPSAFSAQRIAPDAINQAAAILPPGAIGGKNIVTPNIERLDIASSISADSIQDKPYRPQFKLDYIGNTGVGLAVGGGLGTGLVGGVNMLFSDMVGNHQLFGTLALNGEIYDFGGQVAYLNQKNRLHWGVSLSHIPFRASRVSVGADSLDVGEQTIPVSNVRREDFRQFEDELSLFTHYPLSKTMRLEAGASVAWYSFRRDAINNYFDQAGFFVGQDRNQLDAPEGFNLQKGYAAFVGDNASFGMTGPYEGWRYRLQVGRTFGTLNFDNLLVDYRKYVFKKPVSLAVRGYYNGRFGEDADTDRFVPLFIGFPGFVHGFFGQALDQQLQNGVSVNQLTGSQMLIGNIELRLPFTGPEKLALFKSNFLLSDLALFVDGGVAWDQDSRPVLDLTSTRADERIPVFSTGLGLRVNLFGYLVVEPYYAIPIIRGEAQQGVFGVNFLPGW